MGGIGKERGGVAGEAGDGGGLRAQEVGKLRGGATADDEKKEAELEGEAGDFEEVVEKRIVIGEGLGKERGEGGGGSNRDAGELVAVVADAASGGEKMEEL